MLTVHYKYFLATLPLPVECLDGFILSIFSRNFFIKSCSFSAGPTFILSIRKISSSVISSKRLPSTLCRLNVSQCAAQSLIRKNWPTSKIFHESGVNSSPFWADAFPCGTEPLEIKHGICLPDVTVEFWKSMDFCEKRN